MALKELDVRCAAKRDRDYKLAGGGGLYLLVRATGSKLWRMKYRVEGREKLLSFGRYPDLSLAKARLRRDAARIALAEGKDPATKTERRSGMSFEKAARAWHENREASLDKGHADRILARLERDAFPALGRRTCARLQVPTCWR